jgi:patatin-like phospholipase/acyl hydrolase
MSYKILSLDGGGSWALIQAYVIRDLYGDRKGHEILKEFDLAIGNSGGSLVLAGLCVNMKPGEIIDIFRSEESRKKIFSRLRDGEHSLLSLARALFKKFSLGPKYHTGRKGRALIELLEKSDKNYIAGRGPSIVNTPLSKLPSIIGKEDLQLIITGFDYFRERVTFFRSNKTSNTDKFSRFYDISLGDAIHASSNAPVNYFQEYARAQLKASASMGKEEERTNWFWDGAVAGFNNPVLAGLTEAITNNPLLPLEEFKILSIGTGQKGRIPIVDLKYSTDPFFKARYEKSKDKKYVIGNESRKSKLEIAKLAQSILSDPPDSATFIAYSILDRELNNKADLIRINPCITPRLNHDKTEYILPEAYADDEEKFMKILDLDMDAVKENEVDLIEDIVARFIQKDTSLPCLPNQFIRGEKDSANSLGFGTYREARDRWYLCNSTLARI